MDHAGCLSPSSAAPSDAAALAAVCGDLLPPASFTSLQATAEKTAIGKQAFNAYLPPTAKQFKGARRMLALAISSLIYLLECTVTIVVFLLTVPALLIVLPTFKLGNCIFERYISYKRKCIPLRGDDAVWQQDRPTNRHIIHALMVVEGKPDIAKLREIIQERLVYGQDEKGKRICPRMTQVIQNHLGYFVWKEDKSFSMEKHVLNWEGNLPKTLDDVEETIAEICPNPLPENLSPWQFLVFPVLEEDCFGLLLRIHHSVADGVALTRVFVRNLYDVPPIAPEPKKFTTKQRFYMWCKALVVGPFFVLTKFFSKADSSKIHGQDLCGTKVVAWSKNVDLSLVKRVKNITSSTINDVMVSCLAGALHDYLKGAQNTDVVNLEDMWASVPVDIRASSKSVKLKNKFALVFPRLPIVADNAVDRLLATKQRMDSMKTSAEPWITAVTVQLMMLLPDCVSKRLIDFFAQKVSCVISNVPGPPHLLYLGGQKVVQGIFWVPKRANVGVGFSIFSYAGGIRVGVYSDECVIPNPREVVKGFERNFWQLVKELNINENV